MHEFLSIRESKRKRDPRKRDCAHIFISKINMQENSRTVNRITSLIRLHRYTHMSVISYFSRIQRNPDRLTKRDTASLYSVAYNVTALQVVMQCNFSRTKYVVNRLSENGLTMTHYTRFERLSDRIQNPVGIALINLKI